MFLLYMLIEVYVIVIYAYRGVCYCYICLWRCMLLLYMLIKVYVIVVYAYGGVCYCYIFLIN